MTPEDRNKRRQPRFVVEGVHGRMVFASQVEVLNMSVSGVALTADRRLNIGTEYTLKLEVGDHELTVKGVVVWSTLSEIKKNAKGEEAPVYSAGMRFTDVLSQRLMELLTFIDSHKRIPENRLGGMRFHIDAPGRAQLAYPTAYRVKVISRSGMLIETDGILELESRYPMDVSLDDGDPIRFTGRVAFATEVEEDGRSLWDVGIEFLELDAGAAARLDGFIRSLSRE